MRNALILAGVAAVSLTIGAAGGYKFAVNQLNDKYNKEMEEELARTRAFFERTSTPAAAAEAFQVPLADPELLDAAVEAVKEYAPIDYTKFTPESVSLTLDENPFTKAAGIPPEEALIVNKNAFEEAAQIGFTERDANRPYLITMIEFAEAELDGADYEQLEATYFAPDEVLLDDQDQVVENVDDVVGTENLKMFGEDHVIYVRNERLQSVYQVNMSERSYKHEVLGLQHSDEIYERRPRRHRGADE